jgi:hypothetical protein
MAQVTLYLDDETETKLRAAAEAAGLSQSRWVSELIRERTSDEWPAAVAGLAGAWADLPSPEELRHEEPADVPREPF